MTAWILVATGLAAFASTIVYCNVGYRFYQRSVSPEVHLAKAQFSIFWWGLGVSAGLTGLDSALAAASSLSLAVAVTVGIVGVPIDTVFLWAIVDTLIYLYTGRYYLLPVAGLYATFYGAALYYKILEQPYGVVIRAGAPTLLVLPVTNHWLAIFVIAGLAFPKFIAAFLYLSLIRRTQNRTQRFRIAVVSVSIIVWFGITFFFPTSTTAETFERAFLQLVPAVATLIAYLPPQWIRDRLRITGISPPAGQ
jgi:hypothetical protein